MLMERQASLASFIDAMTEEHNLRNKDVLYKNSLQMFFQLWYKH